MLAGHSPYGHIVLKGNFHAPSVFLTVLNLFYCTPAASSSLKRANLPTMTSSCVDIVASCSSFFFLLFVSGSNILPALCLNYSIDFLRLGISRGHWLFVGGWWTSRHRWSDPVFFLIFILLEYLNQKVNDRNLLFLKKEEKVVDFERRRILHTCRELQKQAEHTFNLSSRENSLVE